MPLASPYQHTPNADPGHLPHSMEDRGRSFCQIKDKDDGRVLMQGMHSIQIKWLEGKASREGNVGNTLFPFMFVQIT